MNAVQHAHFVVAVVFAQVIPGVVLQKWPVGMRPLTFNVAEKGTSHLPGRRHTNYRGIGDALSRLNGNFPRQGSEHDTIVHVADGERMLEAEKHSAIYDRRALDLTADMRARILKLQKVNLGNR